MVTDADQVSAELEAAGLTPLVIEREDEASV
jgi:hypothetical protein